MCVLQPDTPGSINNHHEDECRCKNKKRQINIPLSWCSHSRVNGMRVNVQGKTWGLGWGLSHTLQDERTLSFLGEAAGT